MSPPDIWGGQKGSDFNKVAISFPKIHFSIDLNWTSIMMM